MRVIITGDRNWRCQDLALNLVRRLKVRYGPDLVVVHGACRGVDTAFSNACRYLDVAEEPHPADWDGFGNGAGPKRNAEMVAAGADFAIAVHRCLDRSRGTRDCVTRAIAAGISVYLIDSETAKPRRIQP